MAHEIKTKNGGIIIFDNSDFSNGLVAQGAFSSNLVKQTNDVGMSALLGIDPYRNKGVLQPGYAPDNATNATSALGGAIKAAVLDTSTNNIIYGVDYGGKFQQYNFFTDTVTNSGGTFPHTITGTTPVGQDCILYQHNSSNTLVYSAFYSYYNTNNWDVGALVNMTGTPDDDFMSNVPADPLGTGDSQDSNQDTSPHPMCIGSDGVLYIGSGRYLHAYDGTNGANGTFESQVLIIPIPGFVVQGMIAYDQYLYIVGNYATSEISGSLPVGGQSICYIWDYINNDPVKIIDLKDPYVCSIFMWRGAPHVITYGPKEARGFIKLKQLVGNQAVKLTDLPQTSSAVPSLRSVDGTQDTLYINIGGRIITIGNKFTGQGYDINYIGFTTYIGTGINDSGFIMNLQISSATAGLMASSAKTTNYAMSQIDSGYATSNCFTQAYEPVFPIFKYGKIKSVNVMYNATVSSNASNPAFTLNLYTNLLGPTTLVSASKSLDYVFQKYNIDTSGNDLPSFANVGLQMIWNSGTSSSPAAHAITRILIEYEYININVV